jgi:predicted enzyme related to lactoylglutathione lyase
MEVTKYEPGTFSWVDYSAEDLAAARTFYSELFGWSLLDVPTGGDPYIMAQIDGKDVAALMPLSDQMEEMNVPPHWNSYITVGDVDATCAKIKELGGQIFMEPFDVMTAGRMAVAADPTGAGFCLWQPKDGIGAVLVNEPNTFCWNELYTNDLDAAERFYTALFGWTSKQALSSENTKLVELYNGERPAATFMEIQPEWGPMPSAWGVYFAVADCENAIERAKGLGAQVVLEPRDIPPGRFATVQDPQGGVFSVIQLKGEAP